MNLTSNTTWAIDPICGLPISVSELTETQQQRAKFLFQLSQATNDLLTFDGLETAPVEPPENIGGDECQPR